jgi:Fe-S cluster assembly protein SufD
VFTNALTEVITQTNAVVDFYKIQNDHLHSSLIDNTWVKQFKNSNCTVDTFSFGGKLTRNNLNFTLADQHAESNMNGITLIGKDQLVDHHTFVDHAMPNCNSNELYKGIFDENAKGVFNGKVMVRPDAQKTNAFQSNNNLLLTDSASIDTKPQLEIYADDVACSHGCTIGQLDESALFYLRSRGIAKKEAQAMLMYAFANDVLENIKLAELKDKLNRIIADKLGVELDIEL